MKNQIYTIITFISGVLMFAACQSEPDYKAIRKEVLDSHDQIMMDGERAMRNKMKLDTLGITGLAALKKQQPSLDTTAEHQRIQTLIKKLNDMDDRMNDWMHNFKSDIEGKSKTEAVNYFKAEQVKIKKLDSIYKMVLKESDAYLKKFNTRPDTTMKGMHHMDR